MKGRNTCQWLLLGKKDLCGRSCRGMHCKVHLARLRKGPGTRPCTGCGVGVKNEYSLCCACGYSKINTLNGMRKLRILKKKHKEEFKEEFKRLASIEISS